MYRGKEYERLQDFCSRTLNGLPNAELMTKLTAPSEEILNSPQQRLYIFLNTFIYQRFSLTVFFIDVLINAVEPIMSEDVKITGKHVSEQILKYHKFNDVTKFRFSRKFTRKG